MDPIATRKTRRAHLQFMLATRAFMWLFTKLSCSPLSWQVMPLFTAVEEPAQPWGSHMGRAQVCICRSHMFSCMLCTLEVTWVVREQGVYACVDNCSRLNCGASLLHT